MATPLSEKDIKRWEARQEWDIYRRQQFIHLNKPTQQAIIDILVQAEQIAHSQNKNDALAYMQHTIWLEEHTDRPYNLITDGDDVDWSEVNEHIFRGGCIYDTDMEGYQLDSNKLSGEITVFRNLMEIKPSEEDMF